MSSSEKRSPGRNPSPLETLEVPEGYRRPEAKIENIVATVILDHPLDLNLIETRIPDVDYNPDQFPGLVYRLNNPKVTAL
ncbi:MAG: TATA-box-binding protein, partial [Desulfurococcales archaeon]|nr:TATA-box-binding protein [Desulfurococcales archaeon]